MSYIIKKNEPLVNLKLTDTGRKNLSSGNLNFSTFSLGDGEMDYTSGVPANLNILRPVDSQHDIQYPVPSDGTNYKSPISILTSIPNIINAAAKERGFFTFNTGGTININTDLCLVGNLTGTTPNLTGNTSNGIILEYTDNTIYNTYRDTIKKGDYVFIKFKTDAYTSAYSGTTTNFDQITIEPVPFLMFTVLTVEGTDELNITGLTSGSTISLKLDRDLPKFAPYTVDAFIYPGVNTIKDYYDQPNPIAYWSEDVLNFQTSCQPSNDDIPVWNMNIITIDDFIGLDNTVFKGKFLATSKDYFGTAVNYDYVLNNAQKVGVIHYTNNAVSNYYAEGFYENTLKLKLPYLMWHKKQFGGPGLGDSIGYTFVCGDTIKYMGINDSIKYYDLVDQESIPTSVGKVLVDEKIILIENNELLAAMSYKGNRNWTLPTPNVTLTAPGVCSGSDASGVLKADEALHVSYLFLDSNGINGLHCENYVTVENKETSPKDVLFQFPKSPTDPTYSELGYLKSNSAIEGYGFKVDSILLLWQKTGLNSLPIPGEWNYLNVNRFLGTNGCLTNIKDLTDNFELFNESTIYPSQFDGTMYVGLTKQPVGEVIVSLNGLILKEATTLANIGVDGDYYIYPLNVESTNIGTEVIDFGSTVIPSGAVVQFHYLVGETNTSSTIRDDVTIPITGVSISNTYLDGVYINNSNVTLTLTHQPNNGVVYLFYNGLLISSNNYSVYPTGSTVNRRVELGFTPANGSKLSLFYLDNSGLGSNVNNTNFTPSNIENLRVHLDKAITDLSVDSNYILNDFISVPVVSNIDEHSFGDEVFFFGNITTNIKATAYKSLITCNVLPNKFINTANPTFNPNQDKVAFTELGVYDANLDMVAIGKFSQPLQRKYNSDMLIIQATIDF